MNIVVEVASRASFAERPIVTIVGAQYYTYSSTEPMAFIRSHACGRTQQKKHAYRESLKRRLADGNMKFIIHCRMGKVTVSVFWLVIYLFGKFEFLYEII